jgi:hypothetical protein
VTQLRNSQWWRLMWHALPAYVLSRLCVLAGAAVVAAELRVDVNLEDERSLPLADPHIVDGTITSTTSATRPMLDVLTSWDGLWYMDIVRHGYPRDVPPNVTYHVDEARAAFFPLFPMLGRAADVVLPGGDSFAVLTLNTVVGFIAVVLIGLLGARLYGERVGRTTTTLVALFPGSFVLTFGFVWKTRVFTRLGLPASGGPAPSPHQIWRGTVGVNSCHEEDAQERLDGCS